jgi:hypothetical protein
MVPSDVMNDTRKPHTFFIVIGQNKTSEYVMKSNTHHWQTKNNRQKSNIIGKWTCAQLRKTTSQEK